MAKQEHTSDQHVDSGEHQAHIPLRKRELKQEEGEQNNSLANAETKICEHREPEYGLCGGQCKFLCLTRVEWKSPSPTANHVGERQATDQQGPLVHFRRQQRPDGVVSFESGGQDAGHQEFGRLGSQRCQPLDEKKLVG